MRKTNYEQLAELYKSGLTVGQVVKATGCKRWSVYRSLVECGVRVRHKTEERRPGKKKSRIDEVKVVADYASGLNTVQIGKAFGVCSTTIRQTLLVNGVKLRPRGGLNPSMRYKTKGGYIKIPLTESELSAFRPMVGKGGLVFEHRLVMAKHIGRPLHASETVHHINGVRHDNRLENLQLRQGKHGSGIAMMCCDCGSVNVIPVPIAETKTSS